MSDISELYFSSSLNKKFREELETLMYFNPQQENVRTGIINSTNIFGSPKIVLDNDLLKISVGKYSDPQSIFALKAGEASNILVGFVTFVRTTEQKLIILHIAVNEDYSSSGKYAEVMLVFKLINEVRSAASRIRGIEIITIMYGSKVSRDIRV